MVAELNSKDQITLPKEIIRELSLNTGDLFDVSVKDGGILLTPVITFPKKDRNDLRDEILKVKKQIASGQRPRFESVEALLDKIKDRNDIDLPF